MYSVFASSNMGKPPDIFSTEWTLASGGRRNFKQLSSASGAKLVPAVLELHLLSTLHTDSTQVCRARLVRVTFIAF